MKIASPYLLFLGDAQDWLAAKTAIGIAHWRRESCVGQLSLPGCAVDLKLPELTLDEAAACGAKTLVIGVANRGGTLAPHWIPLLINGLEQGFDLANGLHQRLSAIPEIATAAQRLGRQLFDVRHADGVIPVGDGRARTGHRLLTVGTDCSVGKMYTALALEAELQQRGVAATFRATGQTGILIAGSGIAVDAVVADFISGAVEQLAPENAPDHWDCIEGQGSLLHPSFAGVSLGLLHGAQAEALIMCHEPRRIHMRGLPHYPLPDLKECIQINELLARRTCPTARVVGISLNTSALSDEEAADELQATAQYTGLPCVDAVRTGVGPLVDAFIGSLS